MKTKIIINFFIFLFFTSSCKKDDLREYKLEGYAQKGPFLMGSNVTIIELDNNLIPTGKSYYSTIDDNAGHFEIPRVTLSSNYAQIKVEGSYYDENFGGIPWGEDLTLFSTVDISKYSAVNINLMSHIEEKRIKYLLDKDVSFQNAKTQAHNELLKVFNLEDKTISNAEHLNITSPDIDGGILLLISSIIAKNFGTIYTLQEFLLNILTDF